DGLGDACDTCFGPSNDGDTDGDGICNGDDNCPIYNPAQDDSEILLNGTEFLVNSHTTGDQKDSSVAKLENGDFVITWYGSGTGDTIGVFAKIYNPDGTVQVADFLVNSYTTSTQQYPSVAGLENGDFVITWEGYGTGDNTSLGIFAKIYNSSGSVQVAEFLVNDYTTDNQRYPSVAGLENGDFVIAWHGPDASNDGIFAEIYNPDGTVQTSDFLVNSYTTSLQQFPSVAGLANGDFVITWYGYGVGETADYGIFAKTYNPDGSVQTSDFLVNTYTTSYQYRPSVAGLNNGDFVIAWESYNQYNPGGYYTEVFTKLFNATGANKTGDVFVPESSASHQYEPSVAGFYNSNFIVTWRMPDASGTGVYAQVFHANATKSPSGQFLVNTYTTLSQLDPSVAVLDNNQFVIAWYGYGADDTSNYGVYAQRHTLGDGTGDACDCDIDGLCTALEWCESQSTFDGDCGCSLLTGLVLPDSSWGVAIRYENGLLDTTCGNYTGTATGFTGTLTSCAAKVCNGSIEFCKHCSDGDGNKKGFEFFGVNLSFDIGEQDWSSAFLDICDRIGIVHYNWSVYNGIGDKIYGMNIISSDLTTAEQKVNITVKHNGTTLYKFNDSGLNGVAQSGPVKDDYIWALGQANSTTFSTYDAPLGAELPGECTDECDNDNDGYTDCDDTDCWGVGSCPVGGPASIPEFSATTMILTIILVGLGMALIVKKKAK
ncbi:hypothetical protein KY345_01225, partial [Candidatus Woesearchaeota archaeon]|nr:hypothetical protein [Candidatus Woesearchaeota archaeon]